MGFLDSSGGGSGLAGRLGGELLAGGFSSGGLASGLLSAGHGCGQRAVEEKRGCKVEFDR